MEDPELSYEQERELNIRQNAALLESLGLASENIKPTRAPLQAASRSTPSTKRKRVNTAATTSNDASTSRRKSSRIADLEATKIEPTYDVDDEGRRRSGRQKTQHVQLPDDWDDRRIRSGRGGVGAVEVEINRNSILPSGARVTIPKSVKYEDDEEVAKEEDLPMSDDRLPGRHQDGTGRLIFEGRWKDVFEPNVTPEEMFRGGAFGGTFYAPAYSSILKRPLPSEPDLEELPASWLQGLDVSTHLTAKERNPSTNRFRKLAGQGLKEWEASGWIWAEDPRGWAQWYTRFYRGRRCADDERQVQRWLNLAGPTGRFSRALMKKIASEHGAGGAVADNTAVEDDEVAAVLRQVNWQWGFEINRAEWKRRLGSVK